MRNALQGTLIWLAIVIAMISVSPASGQVRTLQDFVAEYKAVEEAGQHWCNFTPGMAASGVEMEGPGRYDDNIIWCLRPAEVIGDDIYWLWHEITDNGCQRDPFIVDGIVNDELFHAYSSATSCVARVDTLYIWPDTESVLIRVLRGDRIYEATLAVPSR